MRVALRVAGVLLLAGSASASEPGQPFDCSDWVPLVPGLTCTMIAPGWGFNGGQEVVVDNDGRRVVVVGDAVPGSNPCDNTYPYQSVWSLRALDSTGTTLKLGYFFRGRCIGLDIYGNPMSDTLYAARPLNEMYFPHGPSIDDRAALLFDDKNGRVLIPFTSTCNYLNGKFSTSCDFGTSSWVASISGLTTAFDIFQTYTPTSGPISFRVPAIPEGLPAADYFDTYYGDLATVGDWSQAQPLQCGYLASPPSVRAYLQVDDPLPNPDPGNGRYYVTAVHYQGQTRYGRKSSGGVLSGRDPAVLPACSQ